MKKIFNYIGLGLLVILYYTGGIASALFGDYNRLSLSRYATSLFYIQQDIIRIIAVISQIILMAVFGLLPVLVIILIGVTFNLIRHYAVRKKNRKFNP